MSNQQDPRQQEKEEGRIYTRVIEQVDGKESVELIDTLNKIRVEKLKWLLDLRVRIK
jgi:hypothetical protein